MPRSPLAVALCFTACAQDFALPEKRQDSISGRAIAEAPGTGRTIPASGARVELVGTGVAVVADPETGRFTFAAPPPPPRTLLVQWSSTPGGPVDRQRVFQTPLLDGPGAIELGDLLVGANAEVRGRVVLAGKAREGLEQVGTVVFVPGYPQTAVTAQGGAFWLPNLPPGRLSFGFARDGYQVGGVEGVELAPGASVELRELTLAALPPGTVIPPGAIKGVARRPDGSPAAGATATAVSTLSAVPLATVADGAGAFQIGGLAAGPWTVDVTDGPNAARLGGVLVNGATVDLGSVLLSSAPLATIGPAGPPPPPVARPGPDFTVAPGAAVLLDGTGSEGLRLIFHWAQVAGAAVAFSVNDSTLASRTSFAAPLLPGQLRFALTVQDAYGQSSEPAGASVMIDDPPVARLSAPAGARTGVPVLLDASASADPNAEDPLTYSFEQTAGAPVALTAGANPATRTFTAAQEGTLRFRVVVDDGHVASLSEEVEILILNTNHAPVVRVANPTAQPGQDVVLDGSLSYDPDGDTGLRFTWAPQGGAPAPTSGAASAVAHVTAPSATGSFTYTLTVRDLGNLAGAADAILTVLPPPPAGPPPVPQVLVQIPADGSSAVPPATLLELRFDRPIDALSVQPGDMRVTSGSTPIPGTVAYVESGGSAGQPFRYAVTFTADEPLPAGAPITVSVDGLSDPYARAVAASSWSFSTRATSVWADISPASPNRIGSNCSCNVAFSSDSFAPALVASGSETYLTSVETSRTLMYSTYARAHWVRKWVPGADAWTEDPGLSGWYHFGNLPSNVLCAFQFNVGAMDSTSPTFPFRRTFAAATPAGAPIFGLELKNNEMGWIHVAPLACGMATAGSSPYRSLSRHGVSTASDGLATHIAFRACAFEGSPAVSQLYVSPMTRGPITDTDAVLVRRPPGFPACNSTANMLAADLWMGPPALASGEGKLYLALALKDAVSDPYAMRFFERSGAGALTLKNPTTPLNTRPVGVKSWAAMTATPKGPILAFVEGTDPATQQIRVTRYDTATQQFVDPATNLPGSSVMDAPLPDGSQWFGPTSLAMLTVGTRPYIAWTASSSRGSRLWVAHAAGGAWVLDPRSASPDGALIAHPGCDPSPPSMALVYGLPTITWSERCVIGGTVETQNFLMVHRLQ